MMEAGGWHAAIETRPGRHYRSRRRQCGDPLIHGGVVKLEELGDFKDPATRVGTIEVWNVQTQRVA